MKRPMRMPAPPIDEAALEREKLKSAWGVCSVCKRGFDDSSEPGGMWNHGCTGNHASTGWQAKWNPDNTPWLPGYRFCVKQASLSTKPTLRHRRSRDYFVHYLIDQEGKLTWSGGVKPRAETQESVEMMYSIERPGSNLEPF